MSKVTCFGKYGRVFPRPPSYRPNHLTTADLVGGAGEASR